MARKLKAVALLVLLGAITVSGCRDEGGGTPAACRADAAQVRRALLRAPAAVTLNGARLSECVDDTSGSGALLDVGVAYTGAAAELADAAAKDPEGDAALQLGYLVGALKRSEAGAQGVGYELARRVDAEVARVDTSSRAFRRGVRAGRTEG